MRPGIAVRELPLPISEGLTISEALNMDLDDPIFRALYTYTKALSVALGFRDLLTQLHSERVRALSVELGARCGLPTKDMNALSIAASFHDIGKIGIPDAILLKPSKLDDAEWETMKKHSEIGETIIAATELAGSQQAALLIRHHHEHFDGKGYPDGLSGQDIPICSRIIAIVDSYDAMAVTRAYHSARTHPQVMTILREETGSKHDPELMRAYCELIEVSTLRAPKT
jgi:HD-GYP domain-containing protein (c-di-GMP phosphodiesterase class II)